MHEKGNASRVNLLAADSYEHKQAYVNLNYFDDYAIGIWHGLQYTQINWCRIQMDLSLFYQHSDSKIYPITPKSIDAFFGVFGILNNFFLNTEKTLSAGFQFRYISPGNSGDLRHNYARYRLNAFCKLLLLNRDFQISIKGNNLTKEFGYHHRSVRNDLLCHGRGYFGDRYFRVSVSYRLGNKKIKVEKHEGSNRDERNRLNS